MLAHERQDLILEMLQETHSIRLSEISKKFGVSIETARRDLDYLQNKGHLRRTHGGGVLLQPEKPAEQAEAALKNSGLLPYDLFSAAIDQVHDGNTLFIGYGSTMCQFSRRLVEKSNLTVMTNSLLIINELLEGNATIYALGGKIDSDERCMSGNISVQISQQFYVDKAFISCGGVSSNCEVTDYNDDATLLRTMLKQARKRYLIAASNKFGRTAFCKVCDLSEFDVVITDSGLPQAFQDLIRQYDIELIMAGQS